MRGWTVEKWVKLTVQLRHQLHFVGIHDGAAVPAAESAGSGAPTIGRIFARHAAPAEDLVVVLLLEQAGGRPIRPGTAPALYPRAKLQDRFGRNQPRSGLKVSKALATPSISGSPHWPVVQSTGR